MCCEETLVREYGFVFVFITIQLITITPMVAHYYLYFPWLNYYIDRKYFLWTLPFNISVLSIWINYYLACQTLPGNPPAKYEPVENGQSKPRWCKDCNGYKVSRTHHCSICNRCVLRMDRMNSF